MMEGLDNVNTRLIICCIVLIFMLVNASYAQEGFVSIQCCADTAFKDPNSTISYISDDSWYPDNKSCQNTVWTGNVNQETNEARYFESRYDSKWCYNLATRKESVYLIRGTFPLSNPQEWPSDTFFSVSVGETEIEVVNSAEKQVEGLFKATSNFTNLCLVKGKGGAYLSKLELRPSHPGYLTRYTSSVLKVVDRVDVGNRTAETRYPQDLYDRIWRSDMYPDSAASYISSFTTNVNVTDSDNIVPPLQVLQTAVTHPERLEFQYENIDVGPTNYILYLYFLELNDTVQAGARVFDVYINDKNIQEVEILASRSPFSAVVLNFTTNGGVLNLTLAKALKSQLGPICNAYEIFQVYPRNEETNMEEVGAIMRVKDELLAHNQDSEVLKTWSGDPCLPLPWHGLSCEALNGASIISKMDLSNSRLTGPLPSSITELKYLKELNLSNNGFIGTVPQFPDTSMLTSLDISHNDLTGNIALSISLMHYLKKLYVGCNPHFNGSLPTNLSKSNLATDNGVCNARASSHSAQGVLIGTIAAGSLLVIAIVGTCLFCINRKKKTTLQKHGDKRHTMSKNAIYSIASTETVVTKAISIQSFTQEYLEASTQKYKTLIGEGGFGSVYRGTLADGQEVAVKVRSATSTQGTREFDNELNLLSAIRHENLVQLIGYCCENDQQILVYPFMSNGSLQDRLYGAAAKRKILDWPTRLSIALGAARGLTYLHTFSERCVIHRDVKSSNILLDHSMCAKVSDFGFSKYAPQEGDSYTSIEVRGTAGYLDPEYYSTQQLSAKSDVFSFGVVLLEIISGREPLNINKPRNEWSLVEWAKPHIKNSKVEEIVDPSIKGGYHAEAMWRVVEVALACIEPYSAYRPCMADIVRELEDAFIIENNASEYMKSIESFGGSNRYSIERPIIIPLLPTPTPTEASPILMQPPPPQPR